MAGEVQLTCSLWKGYLRADNEPKKLYMLVEAMPTQEVGSEKMPLNISFVLDRSGSMADDGKIGKLREAVKCAIDQMQSTDSVSIVAFDDRVDVIVPCRQLGDRDEVKRLVGSITDRGGTEISGGIREGLNQIANSTADGLVSRLVLLTDGQTYGDEDECVEIAAQYQEKRIPITALGLGNDWNEDLLIAIADKTKSVGGFAAQLKNPDDIRTAFETSVAMMQNTVVRDAFLTIRLVRGVAPLKVWRVVPDVIDLGFEPISDRDIQVPLGTLERGVGQAILVELRSTPRQAGSVRIAQTDLRFSVPSSGLADVSVKQDVVMEFVTPGDPREQLPDDSRISQFIDIAAKAQMVTKALDAYQSGNKGQATRLLTSALQSSTLQEFIPALAEAAETMKSDIDANRPVSAEAQKTARLGSQTQLLTAQGSLTARLTRPVEANQ